MHELLRASASAISLGKVPCICQLAGTAGGGSAALGLSACNLKRCWLAGWLPTCLTVGEADGAKVRKLAIAVVALCPVEAEAKRLVSMLELQVAHCLLWPYRVVFEADLHLAASFLAVAFAGLAFATLALFLHGRACARLQECVHVCSDACHFMQCLVKCPALGMQAGNLVPNFAVCLQEFMRVHGAEAGVSRQLLRARIQDLFVKWLESRQARAIAECDSVAKNLLRACKPCL